MGPKADVPQRPDKQVFILAIEIFRIHDWKFYSLGKIAHWLS